MVLEFINCFIFLFDFREYFLKGFIYGIYIVIIFNFLRFLKLYCYGLNCYEDSKIYF